MQQDPSRQLSLLHESLRACRRCVTEGFEVTPPPMVPERGGCQVMLVGQAPAQAATWNARSFSGQAGRVLFSWFARLGLDEETVRRQVYITALTRCYPGKNPTGGDRRPSRRELELCSPFLEAELRILRPRVILPVGQMAIERFLGRGTLQDRVGRAVEQDGRLYVPLPHPSGASRWLNDPQNRGRLDQALKVLGERVVPLLRTD